MIIRIESPQLFFPGTKQSDYGCVVSRADKKLYLALEDLTSWGVGRIRSLYMYPMSFDEFLLANNEDALIELKKNASELNPLNTAFHEKLKDYLKKILIIGGMPEAIQTFISKSTDIHAIQNILADITISYNDDFAKYKSRIPVMAKFVLFRSMLNQIYLPGDKST